MFQEIPGEVTLALNLSGCPCHCQGCHSQHLWEDIGEELNAELLEGLIQRYGAMITCVCFMGGDQDPLYVLQMAEHAKELKNQNFKFEIKTAWYSGRMKMPSTDSPFDYVKIGPYIEELGGLKNKTTNQRLYKKSGVEWIDITSEFWKKGPLP